MSVVGYPEDDLQSRQPVYCSKCGMSLEGDSENKNPQYDVFSGRLLDTAVLRCPLDRHDRWVKEGRVWERAE
jgi:hypothetical protein